MSELEKTVADILVKATNAAEAAGKFAVEQLPDIAQQYVMYMAINSALWSFVGLFVLFGFPIAGWYATRNGDGKASPPPWFGVSMGLLVGGTVGSILIGIHLEKFILAIFAPKILLIQWAATLVK